MQNPYSKSGLAAQQREEANKTFGKPVDNDSPFTASKSSSSFSLGGTAGGALTRTTSITAHSMNVPSQHGGDPMP